MEKRNQILKVLNDYGKLATSRLSAIIGMNASRAKSELEKLKKEGLVTEKKETLATYWELTPKGKKEVC